MSRLIKGFEPIIDANCEVLIVGSMPSEASLNAQEYYAHPQNRFWKLMAVLLQDEYDSYATKKQMLLKHHVALWDVIDECEREGSLDSAISAEVANDIALLIEQYPSIKKILCNGKKSYQILSRKYPKLKEIAYALSSTSPANAGYSFERLLAEWIKYFK